MSHDDRLGRTTKGVRYQQEYQHTRPSAKKRHARKKRRVRSPHPGVVLLKADKAARIGCRARYLDPDAGRMVKVTLQRIDAKTIDTQKKWAIAKSEQLQRIQRDRALGIVRPADVALTEAVKLFLGAGRLRPRTVRVYGDALATFVDHVQAKLTRELTVAHLDAFKVARDKAPKLVPLKGGKRGQAKATGRRSPHSVNKELRAVSAFLRWGRKGAGVVLSRDDIAEGLGRLAAPLERKSFLRPDQIRELLGAAKRHDVDTFKLKRDGSRDAPKYPAITPLVRFLLLTGLRVSEALAIEWSDVTDDSIHVRAAVSKTKQARDVDLTVAPTALPSKRGTGMVFPFTAGELRAAQRRLIDDHEAPDWSPQGLRRTCSTYFTNAFNAWRSAKSIGHSVVIAERHYAGLVKVPTGCTTLEQAMGIDP
jgi:integrase